MVKEPEATGLKDLAPKHGTTKCGKYVHLEGELHALFDGAHVDPNHPVNKTSLVNVVVATFFEQAEKSIIYVARQIGVFEECHLVNEL